MSKTKKALVEKDKSKTGVATSYVVGVGASAGGLEALNEFFDNMPASPGCAFIIIQHLSPDYKSLLGELLSKHTAMKVSDAEDGVFVRANNVYIIPNKKNLTIKHGKLRLSDKPVSSTPNMAIDIFLKSLAEDKKDRAIAVILSGTGSDGTRGIDAVKNAGGLVIVQDPVTAKFDGMPNSAIYSGNSDLILAPEFIPEGIFNLVKENPGEKVFSTLITENDEPTINEILHVVHSHTGCDFSNYKRPTLIRRIIKRMTQHNINKTHDYLDFINKDASEPTKLCKEFLIGVTKFFRDPKAFEALQRDVIPNIIDKKANTPIKIWVAGCSTGEEAYSIAITIAQYLEITGKNADVKIFASDIDKEAIDFAARGTYPSTIERDIPEPLLEKYFIKEGENYKVTQRIRRMVIFACHNLIKDPPFSRMDLISCRNLLIYLGSNLQKKVISAFHFSLNLGGYLLLGPSENIDPKIGLTDVNKKWKIFKNVKAISQLGSDLFIPTIYKAYNENRTKITRPIASQINDTFNETLSEEFNFAGIYVNEAGEIIEAVGDFKNFIHLPDKKLNFNLLKMVPEELAFALGAAIRKVVKEKQKVTIKRVWAKEGNRTRAFSILAKPEPNSENNPIIFLLLGERPLEEEEQPTKVIEYSGADKEKFLQLEDELKETKENLQAAMEELETSNEELQSTVEELLSANEELQSTNEELQSLNEELHTVNTEHEQKIKELIELNDDLNNYFRNSEVGQIFLDSNLIIRKFTPAAVGQINLIDGDIGRPISHISHNMKYNELLDDVRKVMKTSESIEKQVEVANDRCYQVRIMPYIRQDKVEDGIVMTLVDITTIKNLNNILTGVQNSSLNGIMALKAVKSQEEKGKISDFEWVLVNKSVDELLRVGLSGKKLIQEFPEMKGQVFFDKLVNVCITGTPEQFEYYLNTKDHEKWLQVGAVKIEEGVAVIFSDITEKKLAEERIVSALEELKKAQTNLKELNNVLEERVEERTRELAFSEERLRLVSEATNDVIRDWDIAANKMWWNEGFKTWLGYKTEDEDGGYDSWADKIHPEDKERITKSIKNALNNGVGGWTGEYRFRSANENYAYVLDRCSILRNEEGTPYRMLCSMIDVTILRKAQEDLKKSNESLRRINNDLDNFIYTASHDLKAPVSNIEGLIYTLERELPSSEGEIVATIIELIKASIEKFRETIKDLTEITKIQKNPIEDTDTINIKHMVEDIKLSILDMIKNNEADIHIKTKSNPVINFSRKNLKSILYNLLSNAVKYRSPDRKPEIFITTEQQNDYLVLKVKDNGLGIEKEKQGKMFTMFKRFHTHVEGTGVGLYIVKKIVENSGGKIEVESDVNKGTTFSIFFKQ